MPLTLISLTSREAMANLIPAIELNPSRVYLLTTESFRKEAQALKSVMEPKGIQTVIFDTNIHAYQPESIHRAIRDITEREKHSELILNITGGTKLMALAAYEAFRDLGRRIFYCDTSGRRLINIYPQKSDTPLSRPVSIPDYMRAYGFHIADEESRFYTPLIAVLMDWLLSGYFREFSAGVDRFRKKVYQHLPAGGVEYGSFLFQKQIDRYLIHIKPLKETIHVESQFLHGRWLEYLAFHYLKTRLHHPTLPGVRVIRQDDIVNEIDVLYMKDYQLHLISCKTGRHAPKDLFELDTLRHLAGGTFGVGIVMTTSEPTEAFAKRAAELGIKLIWITDPEDLQELP